MWTVALIAFVVVLLVVGAAALRGLRHDPRLDRPVARSPLGVRRPGRGYASLAEDRRRD